MTLTERQRKGVDELLAVRAPHEQIVPLIIYLFGEEAGSYAAQQLALEDDDDLED